jgi:hypothetical protein
MKLYSRLKSRSASRLAPVGVSSFLDRSSRHVREARGSVYDTTYHRALASARLKYANVGLPFTDADGERRCDVNGLPRSDRQLFELV